MQEMQRCNLKDRFAGCVHTHAPLRLCTLPPLRMRETSLATLGFSATLSTLGMTPPWAVAESDRRSHSDHCVICAEDQSRRRSTLTSTLHAEHISNATAYEHCTARELEIAATAKCKRSMQGIRA